MMYKAKIKVHTIFCNISVLNKVAEAINVPQILHDPSVKECLSADLIFDDSTFV